MSIPRLNVRTLPASFSGRLYFVVGPGLGDTVNDSRLLVEVLHRYPEAHPVVYADPRWKALCDALPETLRGRIRYHQPAPSGHPRRNGRETPYHRIFADVMREIEKERSGAEAYLALGGFKFADQLARGESGLAMKARAIGLALPAERCRPCVALSDDTTRTAREALSRLRVTPGRYLVLAPHTHPDKTWPRACWEEVIEAVSRSQDLPVVVAGPPELKPPRGKRVIPATGLPLPVVAGVIRESTAFLGLESGLTHLAAAFDVPIVTLNPAGQFPPFLVEANTPLRWTILTPGLYGRRPIAPEAVSAVIEDALASRVPPACPQCAATPFVLAGGAGRTLFLCRCGLLYRSADTGAREPEAATGRKSARPLPLTRDGLGSFDAAAPRSAAGVGASAPVRVTFDHWDAVRLDPARLLRDRSGRELWWTWDAAYRFLHLRDWRIMSSRLGRPRTSAGAVTVTLEIRRGALDEGTPELVLPWGLAPIRVSRSLYERYLTWGAFHHQGELEGLGWLLAQEGQAADGEAILRLALRRGPRWKTLARWLRVRLRERAQVARTGGR